MCVSDHFSKLHRVVLQRNQTLYTLPQGELRPYFSFLSLANRVSEAQVSDNPVVRHTSVTNKWKTMHLLLLEGYNATQIHYNLTFQGDQEFTMSFTVVVDTRKFPKRNASETVQEVKNDNPEPTRANLELEFVFSDIPVEKRGPQVQKRPPGGLEVVMKVPSVNISVLPEEVKHELQKLDEKIRLGDITEKGYNLTKAKLLKAFQRDQASELQGNNREVNEQEAAVESDANPNQKNKNKQEAGGSPVPVKMDNVSVKEQSRGMGTEKIPTSRLLSSLVGNKAKQQILRRDGEEEFAQHMGRKLQHYPGIEWSFLPWEKSKYFEDLLKVSNRWALGGKRRATALDRMRLGVRNIQI